MKGVGNLSAVTPESGEDGNEIVPGSYTKNLNRGTGSFVIRGLGNIGGSKKVTFKIYQRGVSTWWLARLARMFGLG